MAFVQSPRTRSAAVASSIREWTLWRTLLVQPDSKPPPSAPAWSRQASAAPVGKLLPGPSRCDKNQSISRDWARRESETVAEPCARLLMAGLAAALRESQPLLTK